MKGHQSRLTGRRWRRFLRTQPPIVARWLRWTQTCRDLEARTLAHPGSSCTGEGVQTISWIPVDQVGVVGPWQ